ncbi:hypothetical protein DIPPA_11865 [Diplonema papillatum]|nr:hypothetical protein DIPPA_11865 [Diplonema papillatum]
MPCADCNKKKGGMIVQDKWKDGAQNTMESGNVRAGRNMALKKPDGGGRFEPYKSAGVPECKGCKKKLVVQGAKYCAECANKKGKCSICGKKIFDTRGVGSVHAGFSR